MVRVLSRAHALTHRPTLAVHPRETRRARDAPPRRRGRRARTRDRDGAVVGGRRAVRGGGEEDEGLTRGRWCVSVCVRCCRRASARPSPIAAVLLVLQDPRGEGDHRRAQERPRDPGHAAGRRSVPEHQAARDERRGRGEVPAHGARRPHEFGGRRWRRWRPPRRGCSPPPSQERETHPPSALTPAAVPRAQIAVKNCFIRGSVVRYVQLPPDGVDTEVLHDATRREARGQ